MPPMPIQLALLIVGVAFALGIATRAIYEVFEMARMTAERDLAIRDRDRAREDRNAIAEELYEATERLEAIRAALDPESEDDE